MKRAGSRRAEGRRCVAIGEVETCRAGVAKCGRREKSRKRVVDFWLKGLTLVEEVAWNACREVYK